MRAVLVCWSALLWASLVSAGPLTGKWRGAYAACGGSPAYLETIVVTDINQQVIARKTVGNACVPKGAVSFTASTDAQEPYCFQHAINPSTQVPEMRTCPGIHIWDADHFTAGNVYFTRVK